MPKLLHLYKSGKYTIFLCLFLKGSYLVARRRQHFCTHTLSHTHTLACQTLECLARLLLSKSSRCFENHHPLLVPLKLARLCPQNRRRRQRLQETGTRPKQLSRPECDTQVQGLGFRVQGLGFRVQGLGFRVQGLGFRVYKRHDLNAIPKLRLSYMFTCKRVNHV